MDRIYLNNMAFYGYHGVLPEEGKLGQRFYVDLILEADLSQAGKTDDLNETINYAIVYKCVRTIAEGPPKNLIESVAESIASTILKQFPTVQSCHVKVTKPDPPIAGHYDSVAVEITRGRP